MAISGTLTDPGSGAHCAGQNLRISRDNTPLSSTANAPR